MVMMMIHFVLTTTRVMARDCSGSANSSGYLTSQSMRSSRSPVNAPLLNTFGYRLTKACEYQLLDRQPSRFDSRRIVIFLQ